ncbi:MAG: Fur family transcriptional regulator [Synechococcus sp.]
MARLQVELSGKQQTLMDLLEASDDERSGQQLHRALLQTDHSMGLATVYRHLRQLQQRGLVRCRHLPNGEVLYAPVARDRHHLTCVSCGATQTLSTCPLHTVSLPEDQQSGYTLLFHTLEFYGLCTACSAKAKD